MLTHSVSYAHVFLRKNRNLQSKVDIAFIQSANNSQAQTYTHVHANVDRHKAHHFVCAYNICQCPLAQSREPHDRCALMQRRWKTGGCVHVEGHSKGTFNLSFFSYFQTATNPPCLSSSPPPPTTPLNLPSLCPLPPSPFPALPLIHPSPPPSTLSALFVPPPSTRPSVLPLVRYSKNGFFLYHTQKQRSKIHKKAKIKNTQKVT